MLPGWIALIEVLESPITNNLSALGSPERWITTRIADSVERCLPLKNPRRLLVFAWGRLGDSICHLPLLKTLKDAFPRSELTAVVETRFSDVFAGQPFINHLIECDSRRFHNWRNFTEEVRFVVGLRRQRFDAVFSPWTSKRAARYSLLVGAPVRVGIDRWNKRHRYFNVRNDVQTERHGATTHLIDLSLSLARAIGVEGASGYVQIVIRDEDRVVVQQFQGRRIIVINPGADGREKRWPVERFAKVAKHLLARGDVEVAIIKNPDAPELHGGLLSLVPECIALPVLSVKQLAALSECSLFLISADTGPLHIWQAMGRPVISFAGVTHPFIFNSGAPLNRIIYHPDVCVPGENCKWRPCTRERCYCTESVLVNEVTDACDDVLARLEVKT